MQNERFFSRFGRTFGWDFAICFQCTKWPPAPSPWTAWTRARTPPARAPASSRPRTRRCPAGKTPGASCTAAGGLSSKATSRLNGIPALGRMREAQTERTRRGPKGISQFTKGEAAAYVRILRPRRSSGWKRITKSPTAFASRGTLCTNTTWISAPGKDSIRWTRPVLAR